MSFFQLDDVFTYQDANEIKQLWASGTAPTEPGDGEVWMDTSGDNPILKRYIDGTSTWETIGEELSAPDILTAIKTVDGSGSGLDADTVDGIEGSSFLRKDTDDTVNGVLTSTITSGNAILFDNGDSRITLHDGSGNFNIKCGVDENHTIISADGASHIELAETGQISLAVSTQAAGETFTDDIKLGITSSGVFIGADKIWHAGNDGSGSGLDADTVDGSHAADFAAASHTHEISEVSGDVPRSQLGNLWRDNDANRTTNPYIQTGIKSFVNANNSIWVTFDNAFSHTPRVVATVKEDSNSANAYVWIRGVSTNDFQFVSNIGNSNVMWIAIGDKS